jgi:N-acetylneuraminic acid mutarotase
MYTNPSRRFFCYDPATNLWEEPPPIPGKPRIRAAGIEINGKGYVGGGYKPEIRQYFPHEILESPESLDDFWEYDPEQKQWTAKGTLPEKGYFIAFEAHDKGYFLKGKKMWEYDPLADTWTPKAECPITPTSSFAADGKGYVFHYANVWEYDPLQDTWHEKAAYPGPLYKRVRGHAGKCYVFTDGGALVYDPIKDVWSTQNIAPFNPRGGTTQPDLNFSFSIQESLYINAVTGSTRESLGFYKYVPQ